MTFAVRPSDVKCGSTKARGILDRSFKVIGGSEARQGSHLWLACDFIKPFSLPYPGEGIPFETMCVVGGWGHITEKGPLPSVLQEVQQDLLEQSKRKHVLQTLRPGQKSFTVLCAGPERGGRDACQGYSGGPLLCPRADGRWVAVGAISWGKGNKKIKPLSRKGSPGVFTDVLMFLSWIKSNLRKALYGMPDIFAASGLDTPNTAVDDGKLLCQVTIGLGAGYDCNGAIIQSQWILSDACCVYNLEERHLRLLSVTTRGSKKQIRDVIGVLVHPHSNPCSIDYNVALLKLSSSLNLSESTQAVCLPSAGQEIPPSLHCWALL